MPDSATPYQSSWLEQLDRDGWASLDDVVEDGVLIPVIAEIPATSGVKRGGLRNLLEVSAAARRLARQHEIRRIATAVLGPECFVARALLFDKTPDTNWKVPFHQDLTIAVRRRLEAPGYGPWTIKEHVVHVQPPVEVLERMLAVRIHLDDCTVENGPIRVLPGSHNFGRLTVDQMEAWKAGTPAIECPVPRGGVLLFRPLILHASSPAVRPAHRRVIHFEFAAHQLPFGLEWHEWC